jgi:hypothetical protein
MRRFDASPRRATPKGHNLHHLHSTAARRTTYPRRPPLRARGAQQTVHSGQSDTRRACSADGLQHLKAGRREARERRPGLDCRAVGVCGAGPPNQETISSAGPAWQNRRVATAPASPVRSAPVWSDSACPEVSAGARSSFHEPFHERPARATRFRSVHSGQSRPHTSRQQSAVSSSTAQTAADFGDTRSERGQVSHVR